MRLIPDRYGFGSRFEVLFSRKNSFLVEEELLACIIRSSLCAVYFTDDALGRIAIPSPDASKEIAPAVSADFFRKLRRVTA
jgi:hypothetical protein